MQIPTVCNFQTILPKPDPHLVIGYPICYGIDSPALSTFMPFTEMPPSVSPSNATMNEMFCNPFTFDDFYAGF
jgi:hypothetical protein